MSERKVRGPTLSERISRSQSTRCSSVRWVVLSLPFMPPPRQATSDDEGLAATYRQLQVPCRVSTAGGSPLARSRRGPYNHVQTCAGKVPMLSLATLQRGIEAGELPAEAALAQSLEAIKAHDGA